VIAWLYLTVGIGAFAANFPRLLAAEPDSFMMEVTEAVAIVAGVFLLRRKNWARWLAIAWMAFHVAISVPDLHLLVVHLLFFFVITWGLLRPRRKSISVRGHRQVVEANLCNVPSAAITQIWRICPDLSSPAARN